MATLLSPTTYSKLQDRTSIAVLSPTDSPQYEDAFHEEVERQDAAEIEYRRQSRAHKLLWGLVFTAATLAALYVFVVAIKLIGSGFTLALGCDAQSAFQFANNPVTGLLLGTAATALLHSSSTVTSLTVALVGAGGMTIRQGVYVVMGANVGTCVTCIMVAFGQVQSRARFQRAMAAATVHDMYNIWSVLVMFPLEVALHPLERLSVALSHAQTSSGAFDSPVDELVEPVVELLIVVDKDLIYEIAAGEKNCTDNMTLLRGGALAGTSLSDGHAGAVVVCLGFVLLAAALITFVHMLAKLFLGPTKVLVSRILSFNGYVNILAGALITFVIQSSTVVTSTLTPMAGLGVITLEQVYPLAIGSNLGTCGTALLAALVTGKEDAVAIALVHFWFNLFGILLFYPVPITRRPVLFWARSLAFFSASWPFTAVFFVLFHFFALPGVLLGLVSLCKANEIGLQALGWVLSALLLLLIVAIVFWYFVRGGREWWHMFLERKNEQREACRSQNATNVTVEA